MKRGISIKLNSVMVKRLDGVAEVEERSRSQVIDRALRAWFASQPSVVNDASAAKAQPHLRQGEKAQYYSAHTDGDAPA